MIKLTKFLFVMADCLALLIAIVALAGLIMLPFMQLEQPLISATLYLLTAAGCLLLLFRKASGLLLTLTPACFWLAEGEKSGFAASYIGLCLLVIGLPYLLTLYSLRQSASSANATKTRRTVNQ